jgi:hypothetical protein
MLRVHLRPLRRLHKTLRKKSLRKLLMKMVRGILALLVTVVSLFLGDVTLVAGGTTNGQALLGFNTGLDQPAVIFQLSGMNEK